MLDLQFSLNYQLVHNWLTQGGIVLWVLSGALFIFWWLVFDKLYFMAFVFPKLKIEWLSKWNVREDKTSWAAKAAKEGWICEAELKLNHGFSIIKSLVALFPMIGLLGTVTGMISVFETLAYTTSHTQLVQGISMATIPTMAGMVCALLGMFIYARLKRLASVKHLNFERRFRGEA
ncbi:MotA/TolQ/ExbB proton channel family protein [Vibrio sonorensis]|uniref:MotA/TolQ/ExbB proton channel family protein n=1 Tax=Vibrio sonorensis TaxID=1004316 RepID=UPI0008D9F588|nr:MotA/TolQ/ExbB proton channel family protein [Vibrio sonorensis]